MATHNIEVSEINGTFMAMFEDRKDRGDFTVGLGKTEWAAVADFAAKKGAGISLAKGFIPIVGHKLED